MGEIKGCGRNGTKRGRSECPLFPPGPRTLLLFMLIRGRVARVHYRAGRITFSPATLLCCVAIFSVLCALFVKPSHVEQGPLACTIYTDLGRRTNKEVPDADCIVSVDFCGGRLFDHTRGPLIQSPFIGFFSGPPMSITLPAEAPEPTLIRGFTGFDRPNDADTDELLRLRNLEELDLSLCKVTDDGLSRLAALKHLKLLYLYKTNVSDGAVAALKRAIPSLRVFRHSLLSSTYPLTLSRIRAGYDASFVDWEAGAESFKLAQ